MHTDRMKVRCIQHEHDIFKKADISIIAFAALASIRFADFKPPLRTDGGATRSERRAMRPAIAKSRTADQQRYVNNHIIM